MSAKLPKQLLKVRDVTVDGKLHLGAKPWITGICCMPTGDVIFSDNNNKSILVYAMNYEFLNSTKLSGKPWDVDTIDKKHFVATIAGQSNQIHIFELTENSKPEIHYTLQLPFTCYGIAYVNNTLAVTCADEQSVKLLDMRGHVIWSVTGLSCMSQPFFYNPLYISARPDGLTFIVTDETLNSMTVLSYKGEILHSKIIKNGRPVGITTDYKGNHLVCIKGQNSVIETTDTLINQKVRGTQSRGIVLPQAISYNYKTDQFILSSDNSIVLQVYDMM